MVSGHIDTIGTLKILENKLPWGQLNYSFDSKIKKNIIPKGSIAIDGISLTVVEANDNSLTCHLVHHTIEQTCLKQKVKGDQVNLEFDRMGKFILRSLQPLNAPMADLPRWPLC